MKKFTDQKKDNVWKKTYGFDDVHVVPEGTDNRFFSVEIYMWYFLFIQANRLIKF